MMPPPFAFARSGNLGSTCSNVCSAIAGMLLRRGRTSAPPGRMWSVEMPSPTLMRISPSIRSATPPSGIGTGRMFGPRYTSTFERSFGGRTYPESSTGYFVSSATFGGFPRSRGSVITPPSAVAAAVSGLHRYTRSSAVPLLPGKFRLNVRTDAPFVGGANPIPMHGLPMEDLRHHRQVPERRVDTAPDRDLRGLHARDLGHGLDVAGG